MKAINPQLFFDNIEFVCSIKVINKIMNCDTIKWKAYYRVYQIKDLCSQKFNIYKLDNATNKDI